MYDRKLDYLGACCQYGPYVHKTNKLLFFFVKKIFGQALRFFWLQWRGDQGFACACEQGPTRLLYVGKSADVRTAQWLQRHGTPTCQRRR